MKLRIFTNAYNAMPFIPAQYQWLQQLDCDWSWSISEGPARPMHCSSWRSRVPAGKSTDGTAECLDNLASKDKRVVVQHRPEWDGIIDMNNACLPDYPCLLMQMSSDEVWPHTAVTSAIQAFESHPEKTAASVGCNLYVGPELIASGSDFGNESEANFKVLWRYEPGMRILSYEPPMLSGQHANAFSRQEMRDRGVYFDHLYFFHEKQVRQKEDYYASSSVSFARMHHGITDRWKSLQARAEFPSAISDVFPWAPGQTMAVKVGPHPFSAYLNSTN
jgi:hypothetical protein